MNLIKLIDEIKQISSDKLNVLHDLINTSDQIIILGNGGSNSIASHISIDYQKFLNKNVKTITDTGLLSMLVNDYSYENSYSKFIEMMYQLNTVVILISSSGNSQNILNALTTADKLNCNLVLLSGFDINNKLNSFNSDNVKLKYHVSSNSYGVVENCHQIFLHSIIKE